MCDFTGRFEKNFRQMDLMGRWAHWCHKSFHTEDADTF